MAMIKAQYLGAEKQKKKVLKPSEKFRFNFDWEVRLVFINSCNTISINKENHHCVGFSKFQPQPEAAVPDARTRPARHFFRPRNVSLVQAPELAQARDDTSRDLNPLYQQTHEAALLYGRGMRAGIDRREQKKAGAELERATVAKIRKTQARSAGSAWSHDAKAVLARAATCVLKARTKPLCTEQDMH